MKKTLLLVFAVAVVVGAPAFYGGMKYGQNSRLSSFSRQGLAGQAGANSRGSQANGSSFVSGEVIAKDDQSITVKLGMPGANDGKSAASQGGSKIIFLSDTTEIGKFVAGSLNDLAVGQEVTVTGTTNQDNSLTAKSIQIRPTVAPSNP